MNARIVFVFLCFARVFGYVANLTPGQWGSIRIVLTHPKSTHDIIEKTHKVIYAHYEDWAIHRAHTFRASRPGLCRHISVDELAIYASRGLIQAIRGCNFAEFGNATFSVYASKWVEYALLDGMTELQPLTVLPKRIRKRRGIYYRKQYRVESIGNREYVYTKNGIAYDPNDTWDYTDAWEKVDTIFDKPFAKRAFQLKYSPVFDQVMTNAEVADRMECSEETIRKALRPTTYNTI